MNQNNRETQITNHCLTHLDKEVALLKQYIDVSKAIHEKLGETVDVMDDSPDLMKQLATHTETMEKERVQMTAAIANFLGLPESQATVRNLMKKLDSENRQAISAKRDQLLELESSIQQQNRTNSFLIRQTIDLYQRIAMELSDQRPTATTYSATGELSSGSTTNLLQTDC